MFATNQAVVKAILISLSGSGPSRYLIGKAGISSHYWDLTSNEGSAWTLAIGALAGRRGGTSTSGKMLTR